MPTTVINLEMMAGFLGDSNSNFPDKDVQKSFFLKIGERHDFSKKAWAYHLNYPETGISLGFSDLGNREELGYVYSILPYGEFRLFPSRTDRLKLVSALGASFMDRIFNSDTNPNNKAVSTRINWTFKSNFNYRLWSRAKMDWNLVLGYLHHSNGHVRKPNRGYNSLLFGVSGKWKSTDFSTPLRNQAFEPVVSKWFYSVRFGIGQQSFSDVFNAKQEVFAGAVNIGKVLGKTFKVGGGAYYRFYEHYYDYIVANETLVRTQNSELRQFPVRSASNFGLFGSAEMVLGHFGAELNLGLNIHKPFYQIDWQLNEGYTVFVDGEEEIILGELDGYYRFKKYISGRLGLKYYMFDLEASKKHNFFIGAFINSNLGQADFSELTLGYVHQFQAKQ